MYNYPLPNSGLKGKALAYEGRPTVTIPCGPLTPVLEEVFAEKRINFFVLDVESSEPDVLETIDFSRVKIDVMMIEVDNTLCREGCEARKRVREIMSANGYQLHRFGSLISASDVYVHPKSPFKLEKKES